MAKALARAGVASRRDVERYIAAGRVALNGKVLDTPAVKIGPGDILTVDGAPVDAAEPTRVWRYHKPAGLLTTHSDPQGRPTVFEHLPPGLPRVISVGRLDLASEGLLLLTNDGGLARALELPKTGWVRRYRARAFGRADQAKLDALKAGVTVEGVAYGPVEAKIDKAQGVDRRTGGANLWLSVAITEGKNREVRRVLESVGLKVNRLIRLAYGPFALGDLAPGEAQEIGPRVIREQLAAFVAPQNLPKGDRAAPGPVVKKPGPAPGRRPRAPVAPGQEPKRKAKAAEAEAAPAKKVYKAGWAKPAKRTGRPSPAVARKAGSAKTAAARPAPKPFGKPSGPRPGAKPPATARPAPGGRGGGPRPPSGSPRPAGPGRRPR